MKKIVKVLFITIELSIAICIGCTVESHSINHKLAGKPQKSSYKEHMLPLATFPAEQKQIQSPLTLNRCIKIALANNPDIGRGHFDVLSAKAQQAIAEGERWPTIALQGAYKHYFHDQRLVQPRFPNEPGVWDNDMLSGDIVFKMPLFTAGRIMNEIKAAQLLKESSQYRLARTREELIFNISSIFYRILVQKHIIKSLKFSQKALLAHRKRVSDMIEVQRAAKVDLLRTQVRLAELNQRIVAANNLLSILRRTLVNLLGLRNSNYKMRINGQLTLDAINPDLSESIKRAYANRADYLAMERQIAAQRHRVEIARAGHWPIISLEASYGFRSALNPSTRPSSEEQTEDVGFFGVTADWPIFEGGRIDAKIRKERAKLDSLREQFRKLKLQIQLDVETAILNIKSAKEKVKATEASIAQAKESLRIEREKYTEGRGSITDVLDAQDAMLNAQTSYYYALGDYNVSIAMLHLAIGEEK